MHIIKLIVIEFTLGTQAINKSRISSRQTHNHKTKKRGEKAEHASKYSKWRQCTAQETNYVCMYLCMYVLAYVQSFQFRWRGAHRVAAFAVKQFILNLKYEASA